MRRNGVWSVRLTIAVVLAVATSVSPCAVAADGPEDIRKVEFVEVDGQPCLQPIIDASHVELADFRAAESRWLAIWRPDAGRPGWIKLDIAFREGTSTIQRETVHLDGVVGPSATVCFDINLEEAKARSDE